MSSKKENNMEEHHILSEDKPSQMKTPLMANQNLVVDSSSKDIRQRLNKKPAPGDIHEYIEVGDNSQEVGMANIPKRDGAKILEEESQ